MVTKTAAARFGTAAQRSVNHPERRMKGKPGIQRFQPLEDVKTFHTVDLKDVGKAPLAPRYRAECACGWRSATYLHIRQASDAAKRHERRWMDQ